MASSHPFTSVVASLRLAAIVPLCDQVLSVWLGAFEGLHEACLVVDADTLDVQADFVTVVADLVLSYPDGIRRGIRVQLSGDTEQEGVTTQYAVTAIRIHAPTATPVYAAPLHANPLDAIDMDQAGPRTVIVTIADASETVGPLEPLRAGDRVHAIHKLDFDRLEGDDGTESLLLTSYDMLFGSVADARCILVPEAMHAAMLEHARLLGTEVIDEAAVVLAPVAKPYEIGWATVSHKLIGLCNHEGRVRYVRG